MAKEKNVFNDATDSKDNSTAGVLSLKGSVSAKAATKGKLGIVDEQLKAVCRAELGDELFQVLSEAYLLNHLGTAKMFSYWLERSQIYRRRGWLLSGSQPFDDAKTVEQILKDLKSAETKLEKLGWVYDEPGRKVVQMQKKNSSGPPFSLMGYCVHLMATKNGWTRNSPANRKYAERILRRFFPEEDLSDSSASRLYRTLRGHFEDKKRPTKSKKKSSVARRK